MKNRLFEEIYNAGNGEACVALFNDDSRFPIGLFFNDEAFRDYVNDIQREATPEEELWGEELSISSMKDYEISRNFVDGFRYYETVGDAFWEPLDLYFDDVFYECKDEDNSIESVDDIGGGISIKLANSLSQEECNLITHDAEDICEMFSHVFCNENEVKIIFNPETINPKWED